MGGFAEGGALQWIWCGGWMKWGWHGRGGSSPWENPMGVCKPATIYDSNHR